VNIEYAIVTISGCRVYGNTATRGGGLYLYQSNSTLDANVVTTNTATGTDVYDGGGGLYLRNGGATLRGNTIVSNTTGGRGGGIHLYESGATVSGNRIVSNIAGTRGGGVYLFESGAATLAGNTVSGNTTGGRGGGVCLSYSGATLGGNTVISNTAGGNSAHDGGGGLYLYQSDDAVLAGNTFVSNVAIHEGGGMYLNGSIVVLENNIIADNQANARGSGMYVYASDSRLVHTTIARNRAGDGSGVHIAYSDGTHSNLVLTNTILVSHTIGVTIAEGNSARLEGTLWGNAVDWDGDGDIFTGTGNIWGKPGFMSPTNGDYHITMGSAARDAQVDTAITADIDGEPRPYCYRHDVGADEFWPSIPTTIEILGPVTGTMDVPYMFTAIVEPPTATLPVSYTWSATGQTSTVRTGGISDTAMFVWPVSGPQVITVTAVTGCGVVVSTTHPITISERFVYLPVVLRG
jgi:parallel beta-helix repeat protein